MESQNSNSHQCAGMKCAIWELNIICVILNFLLICKLFYIILLYLILL